MDRENAKELRAEDLEEQTDENEVLVLFRVDGHEDFVERLVNEDANFRRPYQPYALTPSGERDKVKDEVIQETLKDLKEWLDQFDVSYESKTLAYGIYNLETDKFDPLVELRIPMDEIRDKQAEKDFWQFILGKLWWIDKQFGHRFGFNKPYARKFHDWLSRLDYEHGPYIGENRVCGYCGENTVDQYRDNPDSPMPDEEHKRSVAVCYECDEWISETKKNIYRDQMEGMFDGDL